MCVQGDKVKKGQTVAYVDQLGTFVAVEVRHPNHTPDLPAPDCLALGSNQSLCMRLKATAKCAGPQDMYSTLYWLLSSFNCPLGALSI